MSHLKTCCIVLVMANVLLLMAWLSSSNRARVIHSGQEDLEDCGSCKEAIQAGQEAARNYLQTTENYAAIDPDVTITLFKRTGIWTVKGFATSEDSRKFRWVVILAYHPSGTAGDRWELVTVTARLMKV
jgi:hypothetical protein